MNSLAERIGSLSPRRLELLRAELLKQGLDLSRLQVIARADRRSDVPLSFAQQRLWLLDQLEPGGTAYNLPLALQIQGTVDAIALEGALHDVARRHEVLRTTFPAIGGRPVQVIHPEPGFSLSLLDLRGLPAERQKLELLRLRRAESLRPFDLVRGPLLRPHLVQLGVQDQVLLLTLHHIVADHWSMGILVREVVAFYTARVGGPAPHLRDLPVQYGDFAVWQRQWLRDQELHPLVSYWKRQLAGAPTTLKLPTDRPRGGRRTGRGAYEDLRLPGVVSEGLRSRSQHLGATPFMVLLAGFATLLGRYTSQSDVLVGSPIANRNHEEIEGLIGFFVNSLVLRVDLAGDPSFRELVSQVRGTTTEAYTHQDLPFEKLVEELRPERSRHQNPLFQVVLAFQDAPAEGQELSGVTLQTLGAESVSAPFELTLSVVQSASRLLGNLLYDTDLFDATTVKRLAGHLGDLLVAAVSKPDLRLSELPLHSRAELHQLLVEANDTASAFPEVPVHRLFSEVARRRPEAPALIAGGEELSYADLDRRSDRLAAFLRSQGVAAEMRVGIAVERSFDLIVCLLAVLKAGGAFVPLDPAYPPQFLARMLEDAGVALLLGRGDALRKISTGVLERLPVIACDSVPGVEESDEEPAAAVDPDQLAYVMFTSGSTGRPKGVGVTHRGIVRLVCESGFARFAPEEVFLQLAPTSFDASTLEIWGPLLHGGRLVLMPPGVPSLNDLGRALLEYRITTLWLTAGLFHQMVDAELESLREIRQLLAGGDTLSVSHVRQVLDKIPGCRLINGYGPTENTTFTCCHTVGGTPMLGSVPIGRPIANTRVYVLDRDFLPLPIGVPGELFAGGSGLARCYVGAPDLTAEKLVPDPMGGEAGGRLYRTGDLVRWMPDTRLEFLGRADQQVKIRGFRIEIEEIEEQIRNHPALRESAVLVRQEEGEEKSLTAYGVPAPGRTVETAALRSFLRERLPEFMIPSGIVLVDELPLTPNGKVDRRALARLEPAGLETGKPEAGPGFRTPVEELLAEIWSEVLAVDAVGPHDDFFDLGGHSLKATQVVSRIRQTFGIEVELRSLFETPTVSALASLVEQALRGSRGAGEIPRLEMIPRDRPLQLSFAQRRLWLIDQLEPGNPAYNISAHLRLLGHLDPRCLAGALNEIVRRHESLRTCFGSLDGEPVQVIAPPAPMALPMIDLSALPAVTREREALGLARQASRDRFDLSRGPLFRILLVRCTEDDHLVLSAIHHIVSDGWSMGILAREIGLFYEALRTGSPAPLSELPVQYADFAAWQRSWLKGETLAAELAWWRERLAGAPALLELPTDRPREAVQSFRGRSHALTLPQDLSAALRRLARRESSTLFMVLAAAFQALLARLAQAPDVSLGTPVAGRNRIETEGLIGFFVNTLVLRAEVDEEAPFVELLRRTRESVLGAFTHQDVPFEKLVEELRPERSLSFTPLFQVLFALQNLPQAEVQIRNLQMVPVYTDVGTTKFDLTLAAIEGPDRLAFSLEYSIDLFDDATALRWLRHWQALLKAVAADSGALSNLPLLCEVERHQMLVEWNDTRQDLPFETTLHRQVERQADATPTAEAFVFEDGEGLSYRELDLRANRLAHHLQRLGVGRGDLVAVCAERSFEMIVALLGVLKAGAAYVPLDPEYPASRLAFMLEETDAPVLLTQSHLEDRLPDLPVHRVLLDVDWPDIAKQSGERPEGGAGPDDLAYVIYTSGSTGQPKGVQVPHRGVVNRLRWAEETYPVSPGDRILVKASFSFDFSVWEIFGPLLAGATGVLARPGGQRDSAYLSQLIRKQSITLVHFVPSMLQTFLAEDGLEDCSSLRFVFAGGERLMAETLERFHARVPAPLRNQYGPTEASIDILDWLCRPGDPPRRSVPIGRPLANGVVWVVDRHLQPVAIGVPGELLLGGLGVSRGYLRRPDLTAERFIPDAFGNEPGARAYRTGDLVRWAQDGTLEFLGRVDHQVKVRGFRIELAEIDAALVRHPGVREAVALVRGDESGDKRLVAYMVLSSLEPAPSPADLRDFLRQWLPEPMIPTDFVALESLPLTTSGKVDRRALSQIAPVWMREVPGFAAPQGPIEEVLAGIWAEVLGPERVNRVGAHDDFFSLGGHSLLATQVISRVREAFGVEMPLRSLFEAPTLAAFATRIGQEGRGPQAPPILPVPRDGVLPLSFAQQRLWFLDRLTPNNPFYNMYNAVRLTGTLDLEALRQAFREIGRRHEALRTTFQLVDSRPVQVIAPAPDFQIPLIDLEALRGIAPEKSLRDELARLVGEEVSRPFDLAQGPLFRAHVIRRSPSDHTLLINLHHIISDGWSMGILFSEAAVLYGAFSGGSPSPLPELPIQYADFAVWQREWLQGEKLETELGYWRQQLAGIPEVLELPIDHPRPAIESFRGDIQPFVLPAVLVRELTALTRRRGATLSMTTLVGFQALLGRYAEQEDIVTGLAMANRTRREIEGLIGFFVNTLVMRTDLAGSPGLGDLLAPVRETALVAYAHQDLPFEYLVEELQPERALNRNPLVQVMFGYQNFPRSATEVRGLVLSPPEEGMVATGTAKFDLTLFIFEDGDRLQGLLEYNKDIFEASTIRRLLGHFENLLAAAVAQPEIAIAQLPLLNDAERHQLALEWNDTDSVYPSTASLQELFEAQVRSTPDAVAVLFGESRLSYGELNLCANRLAHRLRSLGVGPESRVGLCIERSLEMVVGLLGIVKAGGAYVPLDPDYPGERLTFMMEDASLRVLVGEEQAVTRLPAPLVARTELVLLDSFGDDFSDQNPPVTTGGDSLAYVIYTSGSTGRPKGVAVPHRAIVRLVRDTNYVRLGPGDRLGQAANISFDATTWEVWGALLNGAAVLVIPRDVVLSSVDLVATLREQRVTSLFLTTAMFNKMAREAPEAFQGVRDLLFGGEAADPVAVRVVLAAGPPQRLLHVYGPTESTTYASWYPVHAVPSGAMSIPIGSPLTNTSLFVLNRWLSPVPFCAVGELCIGGDGLAWGYWNRPELTAERFVPHPWEVGRRLYRTGDLVRNRPDGAIEFRGRLDQQVKIRGFRIEPGEIEARLGEHPAVLQNVVLAREDVPGDRRLVAYVVQNPAYEVLESEAQTEQVSQWGEIFDDIYRKEAFEADPTFNVIGWDSTYTGLPLPRNEMEDWLEDTVGRIAALNPRRVLEIGCGTGLILFKIAPGCELYTGTDVSRRAIAYVESQLDRLGSLGIERSHVQLLQRSAEQLDGITAGYYDMVILNSVAQYFPSADYLAEVVERAAEVVRPGGAIFLGDLRSLPLLAAFHTSLELFQAEAEMPVTRLREKVQTRRLQENELVIAPAFFAALRHRLPKIGRVEVYPKRGRAHNELTGFRYQVVLRLGEATEPAEISWLDWQREDLTLTTLRRRLEERQPEFLGLRNVPNARVAEAAAADRLLRNAEKKGIETAGDLLRHAAKAAAGAIEPQDLWDLASKLSYEVELSWASHDSAGCFEVVLQRWDGRAAVSALLPEPQPLAGGASVAPLSRYANNPQQGEFACRIAPELRAFLKERLPEYMVPSSFVLLDSLPLSPNGKVDRRRLPAPSAVRAASRPSLVAPRNSIETKLAEIWRELLGIEQISVEDDFFELGGHSLLATQAVSRVREAFGVELPLRTFFEAPSVAAVAGEVASLRLWGGEKDVPPIVPVPREGPLPLSFAQERLWFLHRLDVRTLAYNESAAFRAEGLLDASALQWSLDEVLRRHESLRTTFPEVEGQAVQAIRPPASFEIPWIDLRELSPAVRDAEARRLALGQALRPFDLTCGPLVRGMLVRLRDLEHVVLFFFHHIAFDGWSTGIFLRELSTLYRARIAGMPSPLPPLPLQYADFAWWQRRWLQGEVLQRQLAYWRERLTGGAMLGLPTDRPRPVFPEAHSGQRLLAFSPVLTQQLRAFSRIRGTTLFMTLLTGFQALLYRYTGQDDISVGSPIANRNRSEVENLIGFFVNMLVLRTDLSGDPSFTDLLVRVRQVSLGAYAHQDLPFEKLVEELRPDRDLRRTPLFQVSFQLLNVPTSSLDLPGLSLYPFASAARSAKFDLDLALIDEAERLRGLLDYDADLFDGTTMERLLAHLERLLAGALENPGWRLSELPLLTSAEHNQILVEWNDTRVALLAEVCLHELFEAQAQSTPEAVALEFEGEELLYGELNRRANQLAHALRRWGVGPGVRVGLCLERSLEMVIALLGVLKAGGAYVPLDPSYPQDRLRFMWTDARTPVLLTQERLLFTIELPAGAPAPRVLCLDMQWGEVAGESTENLPILGGVDDLAYVIYTSGSTGTPKGVMNSHRAICNRLLWAQTIDGLTCDDLVLQKTPFSFDVSVWEFFWPLVTGARLVVARPGGHQEPNYLVRLITRTGITTAHFVPSMLQVFLEAPEVESCTSLRRVICSGEAMTAQLERRFFSRFSEGAAPALYNFYGPTEAAVEVTAWQCWPESPLSNVPIGWPIANTSTIVLDAHLQVVPIGVPGELFIGGVQLARGYLDRPDLTAERFIPDQFVARGSEGARLYRTGDQVRRLPGGEIVYLGRLDHQVKVRGFRIELGEIEAVLGQCPGVLEAVVVAYGDGAERSLVAYVVPSPESELEIAVLREALRSKLPEHMVPSAFVTLERLPLTPNGKLDRKVLPAPDATVGSGVVPPRNLLELALVELWEEVLERGPIGVTDDFFELGGHSLLAIRLLALVRRRFGRDLALADLFRGATVERLAQLIQIGTGPTARHPLVAIRPSGDKPPFFWVHPVGGNVLCYAELARSLDTSLSSYAFQSPACNPGAPSSIETMAELYLGELLAVQPAGPYRLGGWSMGGLLAFEIAGRLIRRGHCLEMLVLLDTYPSAAVVGDAPSQERDEATWVVSFAEDLARTLGQSFPFPVERLRGVEDPLGHLFGLLLDAKLIPSDLDLDEARDLYKLFRANAEALAVYRPAPHPGRITLVRANRGQAGPDLLHAWGLLAEGGIDVFDVAADHYEILRAPHVEAVAGFLRDHLSVLESALR